MMLVVQETRLMVVGRGKKLVVTKPPGWLLQPVSTLAVCVCVLIILFIYQDNPRSLLQSQYWTIMLVVQETRLVVVGREKKLVVTKPPGWLLQPVSTLAVCVCVLIILFISLGQPKVSATKSVLDDDAGSARDSPGGGGKCRYRTRMTTKASSL